MKNKDIDLFIKEKLQKDKQISEESKEVFENFKDNLKMKNKDFEKKVIKINLKTFIAIAACLVLVLFAGISIYSNSMGKPNAISAIQALIRNNKKDVEIQKNNEELEIENLFMKATDEIRKLNFSSLIGEYTKDSSESKKIVNNITYTKTTIKYNEVEEKYSSIFTGNALENVLKIRFLNVNGDLYVSFIEKDVEWSIENLRIEQLIEGESYKIYRAYYNDKKTVNSNLVLDEEKVKTNLFTIVETDSGKKISEIDYLNIDTDSYSPNEVINRISKEEAYEIVKNKYKSNIIEISYMENNVKENGVEYYAFRKEQINADGTKKYLATILITLDGKTIKEMYDPEGTKSEEKAYTEEEKKEIEEDKYNAQAKETINKYFKLRLQSSPDELLLELGLLNNLEELEVPEDEKILDERYHLYYKKTNIKYSTFKNEMLEYMTENMFNQFIYNHIESWYKNVEGKLWVADYRAEGTDYYVEDLELISINGDIYEYFVKYKERGDSVVAVRTMYLEIINGKARINNTDM